MARLLSALLLFLSFACAYAQSSAPEAPVEHASPLTVVIFLVMFIGACVAYVAYTWWRGRHRKQRAAE